MWERVGWTGAVAALVAGCATGGAGAVGAVRLEEPQPVHGDDRAIAWPFHVIHGGKSETLADFHLRIEDGATLVAVRPDRENSPRGERYRWVGEIEDGAARWIGDVLPPGGEVTLTILARPDREGDQRWKVVHWPTNGRDDPVGPQTCEVWRYAVESHETSQEPCGP